MIVCTDGDANVGAHTHGEILKLIEARARAGVRFAPPVASATSSCG